jgi:ABC-2 type transport system permease protein
MTFLFGLRGRSNRPMKEALRMRKIIAVALTEYRQVVLTKSFLFSLLLPLVLYGGMFVASHFFGDQTDLRDRKVIVVDKTNRLIDALREANEERDESSVVYRDGRQVGPKFILEAYSGPDVTRKQLLVDLSDKVREGEAFAFLYIGQDYVTVEGGDDDRMDYYSDSPTFTRLPDWLSQEVRKIVESIRFEEAGYDQREINLLTSHNKLERFSLAEVDVEGNIVDPREDNRIASVLIPFGLVMLIFISIQMTTPVLLNSVIEEKMQRIAEVLLSSLTPFQLLMGKLIAGVGAGFTFSAAYVLTLSLSLRFFEKLEWVPEGTFVWFFVFLLMGMFSFGSLFAGVSAGCQDLKDSQNFAGSIVVLLIIPMMLSLVSIESPDGPFAVTLSLIPPFSILTMVMRIAIPPGPPDWQIWFALFTNIVFTFAAVWASSRIFRIGILSQGKTPSWRELLRWIFQRG